MMVADKPDTKAPPPEAHKPGDAKAASQTLHGHVQEIQANGNVKPNAADAAKDTAHADQHFGKVEIVDHSKQGAHPDAVKPEAAKPEAPKPEPAHQESGGVFGWMKSTYNSTVAGAEHMGEAALQKGANAMHTVGTELHEAKTYVGNKLDQAGHNIAEVGHDIHQAEQKVVNKVSEIAHSDTAHNLEDVGKTLAQGTYEAGAKMVHTIEHAPAAAAKGIKDAAVWAEHNPGKAAAIVAGAVVVGAAVVAAEVVTGGAATAGIAAASGWLTTGGAATVFEGLGVAAAVGGTTVAGIDVAKHGEISTLMNQQHESPEKVAAAREQLKKDTGGAILGDLMLGGGAAVKYGSKALAAMRAGETTAVAGEVATTAQAGEAAGVARTAGQAPEVGEAAGAARTAGQAPEAAAGAPHPPEAPIAGDNPLLTRAENVAEHIAEEVMDAGSATVSSVSAIAGLLDKCRQIAGTAGTAYQHLSDANSTAGVIKSGVGIFGRLTGYGVASPQKHESAPQPANGAPADEPTRH
jgi:hypothetical protein